MPILYLREKKGNSQILSHSFQNTASVHKIDDENATNKWAKICACLAVHPIIVLFSGTAVPPAFDMFTEPMCHWNWQPLLPCLTQSYLNGKRIKNKLSNLFIFLSIKFSAAMFHENW